MPDRAPSRLPYNEREAIDFEDADVNSDENCEILEFCTIL